MPTGPGSRVRRIAFFAVTGVIVVATLWAFREVLAPFALALVVAYVFAPVVDRLERVRLGGRRAPRWAVVLTLYLSLLGMMAASIALGAPLLVREIQKLSREMPRTVATLRDDWLPEVDRALRAATGSLGSDATDDAVAGDPLPAEPVVEPLATASSGSIEVLPMPGGGFQIVLPESGVEVRQEGDRYVVRPSERAEAGARRDLAVQITESIRHSIRDSEQSVAGALATVQSLIAAVIGGVFRFFIMLMLSAYLLITKDAILAFFRQLVQPGRRGQWDTLL